jgi:hypothetical protein
MASVCIRSTDAGCEIMAHRCFIIGDYRSGFHFANNNFSSEPDTYGLSKLFLSFANFRTIFGARQINAPSEFISDIPTDLLEKEGERDGVKTIYL